MMMEGGDADGLERRRSHSQADRTGAWTVSGLDSAEVSFLHETHMPPSFSLVILTVSN